MVIDPKINADDTGRLVSGTDAGNDPADSFVGAVTNTGPLTCRPTPAPRTAPNNFAKPWTGTFQLLNDSGQPVTLPNGLQRQRHPERRGSHLDPRQRSLPERNEAATTSGCVTADPLFDATDFTPGGGDTGSVLISPFIKPGTVSSMYYNHYSWLRTHGGSVPHRADCTNPQRRHPVPPAPCAAASTGWATSATPPRPAWRLRA